MGLISRPFYEYEYFNIERIQYTLTHQCLFVIPKREIDLYSMNDFFPRLIDISKFNEPMIDTFLATNH